MADMKIGLQSTLDKFKENTSKKSEKNYSSVKEGSAAEAAGQKHTSAPKKTTKGEVVMPSIQMMSYQTESVENQSKKYPGLSIKEEVEIDSNPQLSNIAKERMYEEMYGKKQQTAWLNDRANIRKQYTSKQATTGDEEADKTLVRLSQTLDGVREEIINMGGKGVNKVGDMELVNLIGETNPYTAQIINSVCNDSLDAELGAYFLLNEDMYEETMKEVAKQNPAGNQNQTSSKKKKEKVGFGGSFVEGAFSTVKGAAKTIANTAIDYTLSEKNPVIAGPKLLARLITGKDYFQELSDEAKGVLDKATNQWDETVNGDRKFNRLGYGLGKVYGEAGLMTAAGGLGKASMSKEGAEFGTKLANSKYGPKLYEYGTKIENAQGPVANTLKRVAKRGASAIDNGLLVQGTSDLVEGKLSSPKDYRDSIGLAALLGAGGDLIALGAKKFANPGSRITEIVKGEGGLKPNQINQIENEVKTYHTTNKAENPFRTRATEAKEALPKLKDDITLVSEERNNLTKALKNDGNKSTYDYFTEFNNTLKDTDLGNIRITLDKKGKWKVIGGTTAGSEAEKQLKEFVDMINAQSDGGTKSLVDTIAAAKQIAKEAQIAGHTNKMTKAISEFSTQLENDAKALYPDIWETIGEKNNQLSELLGMRNKLLELGDDYSAIADKMNSDTDFYRFMDELYNKKSLTSNTRYTSEHIGNKTLGTYYTMGLRTPELLTEQAKLFYPSVPGLEELALKSLQRTARQTYGGLGALAGEEVATPWATMTSQMYQLNKADNRD